MTVPVPDTRHSAHAVLTAEPLEPATSATVPLPSVALLKRFGADATQLAAFEARPHAHVLHHSGPVATAQADAVAARLEALTLAAQHDGVVVDLAVPRLVTHTADETDPRAPRQWVALDVTNMQANTFDVLSHGLTTFGLPEMRCPSIPFIELAATLTVLNGVAYRLLAEWPGNDPIGPATVTLADIAHALGEPAPPRDEAAAGGYGVEVSIALADEELAITIEGDAVALFT